MTSETTKIDTEVPITLLKSFDKAVQKETGMKHGRAAKIRELIREYVKNQEKTHNEKWGSAHG